MRNCLCYVRVCMCAVILNGEHSSKVYCITPLYVPLLSRTRTHADSKTQPVSSAHASRRSALGRRSGGGWWWSLESQTERTAMRLNIAPHYYRVSIELSAGASV